MILSSSAKDRIRIDRGKIGYTYDNADIIGSLVKITETDESVSEGNCIPEEKCLTL